MSEPLTGVLGADFSKFVAACETASAAMVAMSASSARMEAALNKSTDSTDNNTVSFGKLVSSYVTGEAVIGTLEAAYGALVGFMESAITSAADSEKIQAKLNAALQAQGTNMPSVIAAYNDYAAALQNTTTFSDDTVRAAEGVLVTIGQVMPKDMKAALDASANLAAGLGIDLPDAAGMLAKAIDGSGGALKKAGVNFDDAGDRVVSFGEIIDGINDKFGGQSAAAAETYAGKIAQLENSYSGFLGALGRVVTQNQTVLTAFDLMTGAINRNTGELNSNKTANELVSDAVILVARGMLLGLDAASALNLGWAMLVDIGNTLASSIIALAADTVDAFIQMNNAYAWINPMVRAQAGWAESMKGAADASAYLRGRVQELAADTTAAQQRYGELDTAIGSVRDGLAGMITTLETTRGGVVAHTNAITDNTRVTDGNTQSRLNQAKADAAAQKASDDAAAAEKRNTDLVASQYATLQGLHAKYVEVVGSLSHDSMQAEIDNIHAVTTATAASLLARHQLTAEAMNELYKLEEAEVNKVIQKRLEADPSTREHFQLIADKAQEAYDFALNHSNSYTTKAIENLRTQAQVAKDTLQDWADKADAALDKVGGTANATSDAIQKTNDKLQALTIAFNTPLPGADIDPAVARLMAGGATFAEAWAATATTRDPFARNNVNPFGARAAGGPVSGGVPYLVGERGPELFVPGATGAIVPLNASTGGGGGAAVLHAGAVQVTINYPIMNDAVALDQIARIVGDAVMSRVSRAGTVV